MTLKDRIDRIADRAWATPTTPIDLHAIARQAAAATLDYVHGAWLDTPDDAEFCARLNAIRDGLQK